MLELFEVLAISTKDHVDTYSEPKLKRMFDKLNKIGLLSNDSLESFEKCHDYAYLLFFSLLPVWIEQGIVPADWIIKATQRYPESVFLNYILAYLNLSSFVTKPVYTDKDITIPIEKIKDCLKKEPDTILSALEEQQNVYLNVLNSANENLLGALNNKLSEGIFPNLPMESTVKAIASFGNARLARFYRACEKLDEHKDKLTQAMKHFKGNSLALTQLAYLELEKEKFWKAEKIFKDAFYLVYIQFDAIQKLKNRIKYDILVGLAYIYYKKGQYEYAERKYNEALEVETEPYFKALAILNRGRVRLEKGDLLNALEDLSAAKSEPNLEVAAHTNLGLVYLKQGLYGKAEDELNAALNLDPDLPHPYHNLGVLYNEQGDKNRAKKLFQTAISVDKNFTESRDALRKLEGSELGHIGQDWYDWWFGKDVSKLKKGFGIVILILTGILIARANYYVYYDLSVPGSLFAVLVVNIVILLLPIISKLKMGPVELEVESKGERPVLVNAYSVGYSKADTVSAGGIRLLMFDFILY